MDKNLKITLLIREDKEKMREVSLDEAKEILRGIKKIRPKVFLVAVRNYHPYYITALSQSAVEYNQLFHYIRNDKVEPRYLPIKTSGDRVYLKGKKRWPYLFYDVTVEGKTLPIKYEALLLQVHYRKHKRERAHLLEVLLLVEGEAKMEKQEVRKLRKFIRETHRKYVESLMEVFGTV